MQPIRWQLKAWITEYCERNRELLASDPGFAKWLERDYQPIAGSWQY